MINALQSMNLSWQGQLNEISRYAKSEHSMLLIGPSGSGKDVLAREIHRLSSRSKSSVVAVNCAAIHESLVESELFGHRKGSFTGAQTERKGAFMSADKGTLFLDEIGDLSLSVQAKLLRTLENGKIKSVGDDFEKDVDVRIIAATHKPLEKLVESNEFRMDLYYRLNVIQVRVPPLAERPEDIPQFIEYFSQQHKVQFTQEAISLLAHQTWEGNIRELRNFTMKAACLNGAGQIDVNQVGRMLLRNQVEIPEPSQAQMTRQMIQKIERGLLLERLVMNNWNQRKTARDLGMPKSTLHDQLKKLKLKKPEEKLTGG